ncbi:MAG: hypothetical protein P8R42_29930 [Candidatus Binatia bacterium]|nr:hypothetical protein [Candidatus Binatia bacterium]
MQAELVGFLSGRIGEPNAGAVLAMRKLRYIAADYSFLEDLYDEFNLDRVDSTRDIPTAG